MKKILSFVIAAAVVCAVVFVVWLFITLGATGLRLRPVSRPDAPPPGFSVESDEAADVTYDEENLTIRVRLPEEADEFKPVSLRFPERYSLLDFDGGAVAFDTAIPIDCNAKFSMRLQYHDPDGSERQYDFSAYVSALPAGATPGTYFEYFEETDTYAAIGFDDAYVPGDGPVELGIPGSFRGKPVVWFAYFSVSQSPRIESIRLAADCRELPEDRFASYRHAARFSVDPENETFRAIDGVLYDKTAETLAAWPSGRADAFFSVPDGVRTIGAYAFYGKERLSRVTLPESLSAIASTAFAQCPALSRIDFPESLETLGEYAFWDCPSLGTVTLPVNLRAIGDFAFYDCEALTRVALPEKLAEIGQYAFSGCLGLESADLPEGLVSVGAFAFETCALRSVTLPKTLRSLGEGAFAKNIGLAGIDVAPGNANFKSVGGVLYNANLARLRCYPAGMPYEIYVLPESVTSIGKSAFAGAKILQTVRFPNRLWQIDDSAFDDCHALETIELPASVVDLGRGAFRNCAALRQIYLGESVTAVGENAFAGCRQLWIRTAFPNPPEFWDNAWNPDGLPVLWNHPEAKPASAIEKQYSEAI